MATRPCRTICWIPTWNKRREAVGLEHLLLAERSADSIVLAFDEEYGPFRLTYRLAWDESWRLRDAALVVASTEAASRRNFRSMKRALSWTIPGCFGAWMTLADYLEVFSNQRLARAADEVHSCALLVTSGDAPVDQVNGE